MNSLGTSGKTRHGQSLQALSKRTGKLLNDELTGVVNSSNHKDSLDNGEEIKIVKRHPNNIKMVFDKT